MYAFSPSTWEMRQVTLYEPSLMGGKWSVPPDRRTGKVEQAQTGEISELRTAGVEPAPCQTT